MRPAFSILMALALAAGIAPASEPLDEACPPGNPREEIVTPEPVREPLPPDLFVSGAVPIEPSPKGDPMATDFQVVCGREKLFREMLLAYEEGERAIALEKAALIVSNFPGAQEAISATTIIDVYEGRYFTDGCEIVELSPLELPSWVCQNTRDIFYHERGISFAIVGFDRYLEGQYLREYPHILIEAIRQKSILFRVRDSGASKLYEVTLSENVNSFKEVEDKPEPPISAQKTSP